jgi:RecG-like helicase
VLLSTTIVESGLDVPTANTLIVHRADMFGLAQLYQLRGRVGRSKVRAFALFTLPVNKTLTATADKRLKVLQSLDTLGAGFQLASHDLDIRGAGKPARRGTIRPHQGSRFRALPADARRGGARGARRGRGDDPANGRRRSRSAPR